MKLKSLYIKDYNILQDFSIDFTSNLSVLIGENGSGKSSIIECLAYIFGHLHKYFVLEDKTSEFINGYKISYSLNNLDVFIESRYVMSETNTFNPIIIINGSEVTTSEIKRTYPDFSFLPTKIVLSYSGITDRLRLLSKHFEEKFIKKIIRLNNPYSLIPLNLPTENPFIYIKKEYVSFILLALFVLNTDEANKLLQDLGIDIDGCTTKIVIKKPYWANQAPQNENLWGISGKIAQDLFEGLFAFAISDEIENQNKIEYELYGSLMVRDLFGSHYNLDSSNVLLFLDTLLCDDLLESIDITWGECFSIDKLSEGEKQIILSIGLSLVLNKKNILFLLDEPDISLHPKWQQDFISNFTKGLNEESMAVITTHSPSVASDLFDNNLCLIRKGKIITKAFKYYGKNVDDILCDYFGLESTRNKDVSKRINYLWEKINNNDFDNVEFKNKKDELKRIIGSDDPEITAMELDILRKSNEKDK